MSESNNAKTKAYEICKERGHVQSGYTAASNPPWNICKYCGTYYRYESLLKEINAPEKLIAIPFGSWDLDGNWHHNPLLKMSKLEQYEHNLKSGFIKPPEKDSQSQG